MPIVVREDIDNLNAVLTVTITREDLKPKLNSELKKFRQKAQLKGFRKGKTPMGFIKKMYGQSIMMDVVNNTLQNKLEEYLKEEKIDLLGQPIPSTDQAELDMAISGVEDLVFKFDLGLAPDFEVAGADKGTTLSVHKVEIPEEMITKDLDAARKRMGKREAIEEIIQEGDSISIQAQELDGDAIKLDGWPTDFTILYNDIGDEAVKADLATKKVGDTFRFSIKTIEGEKEESYIRKYLLNVGEEDGDVVIGDEFEGTITEVNRVMLADLDEDFFNRYFGEEEITTEEEARNFLKKDIEKYYDNQADGLLFRDIQEMLLEKNEMQLPDEFLKRWLVASNEKNTPELIEKDYPNFSESLKWTILRGKLAQKYDISVSEEEVIQNVRATVQQYYGMYLQDEGMLNNMVSRMLQDQKHVERTYENLLADKIFKKVKEEITVEEKAIEKETFEKIMEEARAEVAAKQAASIAAAEEEE